MIKIHKYCRLGFKRRIRRYGYMKLMLMRPRARVGSGEHASGRIRRAAGAVDNDAASTIANRQSSVVSRRRIVNTRLTPLGTVAHMHIQLGEQLVSLYRIFSVCACVWVSVCVWMCAWHMCAWIDRRSGERQHIWLSTVAVAVVVVVVAVVNDAGNELDKRRWKRLQNVHYDPFKCVNA